MQGTWKNSAPGYAGDSPAAAIVSTYPPARCGIGRYTECLRDALLKTGPVQILAERVEDAPSEDAAGVHRVWHRHADWVSEIPAAAARLGLRVVHVQHEDGILGRDRRMIALADRLRDQGVALVVTLHSVYQRHRRLWPGKKHEASRFYGALARAGAHLVAHQAEGMAERLIEYGAPSDRVTVIPHGTPRLSLPDKAASRRSLGLPETGAIALFFGFIHKRKGVSTLVSAFRRIGPEAPGCLVIAGEVRLSGWRHALLRRAMAPGIEAGRILFRPGFVTDDEMRALLAASDVLCLPHEQRYGSASGVLHSALAAGKAIICTDGPKFAELAVRYRREMPALAVPPGDTAAWAAGLRLLLTDPAARARSRDIGELLADETRWSVCGERHRALYERVGT